jgi:uncharacterized protein YjbI with pentapeptide repeats
MADPEWVEILRQGGRAWNRWREQQSEDVRHSSMKFYPSDLGLDEIEQIAFPQSLIDLSGANLSGADLYNANLSGVNLSGANLSGANLHRANLTSVILHSADLSRAILHRANLHRSNLISTNLSGANLRYADLSMAFLCEANLKYADLSGANLNEANLTMTNLNEANLSGANLSMTNLEKTDWTNATIGLTQFDSLDLRGVIGLETVRPIGPSPVGLDTIYYSRGQIPEVFLRRAGVPETFITNMRSLVESMSPIEFYSCFICYSHHNEDFAKRLYADLQAQGVRCWFAPRDLKIGDHYYQRVDEAIHLYDKFILILSEHAVQSSWVEREVVAAREKEDRQQREVLFPLRLDDAVIETDQEWAADVRRRRHIGDFTQWKDHDAYQKAFDRLRRDLKAESHTKGEADGKPGAS